MCYLTFWVAIKRDNFVSLSRTHQNIHCLRNKSSQSNLKSLAPYEYQLVYVINNKNCEPVSHAALPMPDNRGEGETVLKAKFCRCPKTIPLFLLSVLFLAGFAGLSTCFTSDGSMWQSLQSQKKLLWKCSSCMMVHACVAAGSPMWMSLPAPSETL